MISIIQEIQQQVDDRLVKEYSDYGDIEITVRPRMIKDQCVGTETEYIIKSSNGVETKWELGNYFNLDQEYKIIVYGSGWMIFNLLDRLLNKDKIEC